jgi:hypothetical protein
MSNLAKRPPCAINYGISGAHIQAKKRRRAIESGFWWGYKKTSSFFAFLAGKPARKDLE